MTCSVLAKGRFENHRRPAQPAVGEQPAEEVESDLALSQVRVPVTTRAEPVTGVVEMNAARFLVPEEPPQPAEELEVASAKVEAIAGGEGVTGVDAEAEPVDRGRALEDRGELFEAMPEYRSLPGSDLQKQPD